MNVLYLTYDGLMDPLGQSQILPYISKLSEKGINFHIISLEKKEKLYHAEKLKEELKQKNIHWEFFMFHSKKNILNTIKNILQIILRAYATIKNNRINTIHSRSFVPGVIGLILKFLTYKKLIFDARSFWVDERIDRGMWKKGIMYKLCKMLEYLLIKNADNIVVLTNAMKNELLQHNKNINVIPTCVDIKVFKPAKKNAKELKIIYSGSVAEHYLIEKIIHLFSLIIKKIPNAKLNLLINNNIEIAKEKLDKFDIPHEKYTIKTLNYYQIPESLAHADFGITFLDSKYYSAKGVCFTKVGEYLSCGLPIIINKGIGDFDELLGECGIFIEDFNETEYLKIIEKIKALKNDKKIIGKCRKLAETYFDIEKGVNAYFKIYTTYNTSDL